MEDELSLKDSQDDFKSTFEEKKMTTKEVADALGVSVPAVLNRAKQLGKVIEHGKAVTYSEQEVAEISRAMKSSTASPNSKVNLRVTTRLEVVQNIALALQQANDLVHQLTVENEQLQIELDKSKEWYSVKRVTIEDGREFPWRPLKKYSDEHGYEVKKVFDQNYGEVNAYHIDVWHKVYGVEL